MRILCVSITLLLLLSLASACSEPTTTGPSLADNGFEQTDFFYPAPEAAAETAVAGQLIYVPVYSRVYLSNLNARELTISLSIRNTDLERPVTVRSVQYYGTSGALLEDYLPTPYQLAPLATAEFFISHADDRGGSGANFLVEWTAGQAVNEPVVEAVMVSIAGNKSIAFARSGQVINAGDRRPSSAVQNAGSRDALSTH